MVPQQTPAHGPVKSLPHSAARALYGTSESLSSINTILLKKLCTTVCRVTLFQEARDQNLGVKHEAFHLSLAFVGLQPT